MVFALIIIFIMLGRSLFGAYLFVPLLFVFLFSLLLVLNTCTIYTVDGCEQDDTLSDICTSKLPRSLPDFTAISCQFRPGASNANLCGRRLDGKAVHILSWQ